MNNILVRQGFVKSIPKEKKKLVLERIQRLIINLLESNYDFSKIPSGYNIKEIKGRKKLGKIFKFVTIEGERVLFTYGNQCGNNFNNLECPIILLEYVSHDIQINRGREISLKELILDPYELNGDSGDKIDENKFDSEIDNNYREYDIDINNYITRVVQLDKLLELSDEQNNHMYYLNDEQYSCLDNRLDPVFLKGGAGTGKTTIGIYKLHKLCNMYNKIGYFTYSATLKNEVNQYFNNLFEYLNTSNKYRNNVQFNSINEFFLENANDDKCRVGEIFKFDQFIKWYKEKLSRYNKFSNISIEVMDIWREIRGVIKGIVGKNWVNGQFNLNHYFDNETIEFLLSEGFVRYNKNGMYNLNTNYSEILDAKHKISAKEKVNNDINQFKDIITKHIAKSGMITLDEYLDLSDDFSIYNHEERRLIYSIAEHYQSYLLANNKLDENDIARVILFRLSQGTLEKFDYIMIDEIQDLTEIQIYTLYNLSRYTNNFYMNGDFNQTINPTLFRLSRMESLFKSFNSNINFNSRELKYNYRNSKGIIEFTNEIIKIRNRVFKENDNVINGMRYCDKDEFERPILLSKNSENKTELFKAVLERAYVAIIVSDEKQKIALGNELSEFIDKEELQGAIFTVNEVKGLERKYIVCYNLISSYLKEWEYMINDLMDKVKRYDNISRFRYYFNILYVAITRARDNICFYEEIEDLSFYTLVRNSINVVEHFDLLELSLDKESDSYEYYKIAEEDEKKELYDSAIRNYKKSKSTKGEIGVWRCMGKKLIAQGDLKEAVEYLRKTLEHKLTAECYEKLKKYSYAAEFYLKGKDYYKAWDMYKALKDDENEMKVLNLIIREEYELCTKNIEQLIEKNNTTNAIIEDFLEKETVK